MSSNASADLNSPTTEDLISLSENGKGSPEDSSKIKLKKELGLIDAIGIIVGIIIGSGIFVSPKGVLRYSESTGLGIIVWILSGLLSTIGALSYAELGTMIPKSGGDYAYLREAFGPLLAFLYMWSAFIVIIPAGNAVISITFAQYLLKPLWMECNAPFVVVRLIAAAITCILTFLNTYNVKWVAKVQDTFSLTKVMALVVIIICGFWGLFHGETDNLDNPMEGSNLNPAVIALSFYSGIFSFSGWNYLNFVTEEIKNPFVNLPRAIILSMPAVTIIYVLVNFAYFIVLSKQEILSSDAVAVTFGSKILGSMHWIIPIFVACSTLGSLNGNIFASSRLFFVGAQHGHLPKAISLINIKRLTPIPSLFFMCILSLILLAVEDVYSLINYTTFVESLFTLFSLGGLLWLRYKQPELRRPIKVNIFFPTISFIVFAFLVTVPFFEQPVEVFTGLFIILSGIPVYLVFIDCRNKMNFRNVHKFSGWFNGLFAKLFLCVPEEGKIP